MSMYKRLSLLLATILVFGFVTMPAFAATDDPFTPQNEAAPTDSNTTPTPSPSDVASGYSSSCKTSFIGIPTWYKYLKLNADCSVVNNGLSGTVVLLVIMVLIEILLVLGGIVAAGFIIFGSFKFVLSQGEPQKIAGARTTILNAVIGLVVALIGGQLVSFIARTLST
jgi:hypothetical protein